MQAQASRFWGRGSDSEDESEDDVTSEEEDEESDVSDSSSSSDSDEGGAKYAPPVLLVTCLRKNSECKSRKSHFIMLAVVSWRVQTRQTQMMTSEWSDQPRTRGLTSWRRPAMRSGCVTVFEHASLIWYIDTQLCSEMRRARTVRERNGSGGGDSSGGGGRRRRIRWRPRHAASTSACVSTHHGRVHLALCLLF